MKTKDFFSKMNINSYNNELEKVLEKKKFNENVKNLLLSMLYKIELSFKDYEVVKQLKVTQSQFIEDIIRIIDEDCDKIELVEPNSKKGKVLTKYKLNVVTDQKSKSIITFPTEKDLLYAIFQISNENFGVSQKYYIMNKTIPVVLKNGNCMNNKEIIRDFNGWSWNLDIENIENFEYNIIYENLRILVGYKFLYRWIHENATKIDYLLQMKEILLNDYEFYGKDFYDEFLNMTVVANMHSNKKIEKYILEEKASVYKQLDLLSDKTSFLEKISEKKRISNEKIKKIDKIIINKENLKKEFKKLKEKDKITSIKELDENLRKKRDKLIKNIEDYTKLMNPKEYIRNIDELKRKKTVLDKIDKNMISKEQIIKKIIEFQKVFLNCIEYKIEHNQNKADLLELIYHLRYYRKMPIRKNVRIEDVAELKSLLVEVEKLLVQRAIDIKLINKFSKNDSFNFEIINNILNCQVIRLEDIELEIIPQNNRLQINVYDKELLENKFEIEANIIADKNDLKNKKKFKLFI